MKINSKLRLQILAQNWMFVVVFLLLVVMVGYLTHQYRYAKDITQANRNILTQGSVNVLKQMQNDVNITVYATNDDANNGDTFRKSLIEFMARYQREKKNIFLTFVNPTKEPKLAQDAGVKVDGETVVEYNKRTEHITPPFAEQEMTNLLVRLSRTNNQPIMYLDGHGERHLQGIKNHDLGEFGKQLESKGFKFANPDLTIAQGVPANGSMLVIASPQVDVSEIEAKKIKAYIEAGGNVLWLLDDNNLHGMKEVADYLGLTVSPGIVIDKSAEQYNADPKVAFASFYGDHTITRNFQLRTVFPEAHEIDAKASDDLGWKVGRLVDVAPNGWLESDKVPADAKNFKVTFDRAKDKPGPINIGVALEREYGKKGQRVVVIGNANFLSNTFITNGGNLDFGINIINWLAGDDRLITIQPMPLKDVNISIPQGSISAMVIGYGTQFILPVVIFLFGIFFWWKRRKA
ncbi:MULTISPECIES: GldG family protein [unclassified Methylotenera]|uniref:GldG family protein n=1 Tax=unclassified Methylotenera TaxID=2643294 RepID=UPI000368CD79|nr:MULTISPECIES: Gldg family protein [unclassified Methylotenera]